MEKLHQFILRVYYEDTDFSGVVYHASYLRFLERGRTEYLRQLGVDQRALFNTIPSIGFAVRHMDINFIKPAFMDDEVTVETCFTKIGGASINLHQKLSRGSDILISAHVQIACMSVGRAARLPTVLKNLFSQNCQTIKV